MRKHIIISTAAANKDQVPAGLESKVKPWTDFCHNLQERCESVYIDYSRGRDVGNWGYAERSRPFIIRSARTLNILSSAKTLAGAVKAANRFISSN
jgi:hypothetical protein